MVLRKRTDKKEEREKVEVTMYLVQRLAATFAMIAMFFGTPVSAGETLSPGVSATLDRLYLTAYDEAISRHAAEQRDGTTFVSTGDISAEWLRDASAVARPYIGLSIKDPDIARTLRGVVAREAKYI